MKIGGFILNDFENIINEKNKSIYFKIKESLQIKKLKNKDLAIKLKISPSTLNDRLRRLKKGKGISVNSLIKISSVLNIHIKDLF